MLAKRIIPCLDITKTVKPSKASISSNCARVGDPVALGRRYAEEGADELVYLDISATFRGTQKTFAELVTLSQGNINIPFTVGGGISTVDDAGRLLGAGADKVSINSAAVRNPELIGQIASKYGSQFVVVAIDAKNGGRTVARDNLTAVATSPSASLHLGEGTRSAVRARYSSLRGPRRDEERLPGGTPTHSLGNAVDPGDRLKRCRHCTAHRGCIDPRQGRRRIAASIFHYGEIPIPVLKTRVLAKATVAPVRARSASLIGLWGEHVPPPTRHGDPAKTASATQPTASKPKTTTD